MLNTIATGIYELPDSLTRSRVTSFLRPQTLAAFEATNFAATALRDPIEVRGEEAYFRPRLMALGQAYPFEFLGVQLIAVKREGDAVDIYQLP